MSQKTINCHLVNLEKIFDSFYNFINYEKEYVWQKTQVLKLLNDVYNEFSNTLNIKSNEYFLGTIVICNEDIYQSDENIYQVIDGQQRLITFYIFFCVIKNYLNKLSLDKNFNHICKYIFSSYTNIQGNVIERCRIKPLCKYDQKLLEEFNKNTITLETENINKTQSTVNLLYAYKTIEDFIKEKFNTNDKEIKKFYAYFLKNVKLILIETIDINQTIKVFETIDINQIIKVLNIKVTNDLKPLNYE